MSENMGVVEVANAVNEIGTDNVAETNAVAVTASASAIPSVDAASSAIAGPPRRRGRKGGDETGMVSDDNAATAETDADDISADGDENGPASPSGQAAVGAAGSQAAATSSIGGFLSSAGLALNPLVIGGVVVAGAVGVAIVAVSGGDSGAPANHAPLATADTATATEDAATVTGSVATNDSDPDSEALTFALASPVAGLTVATSGSWSFDPANPAYQGLGAGETRVVTANYTVSDGRGGSATSTLTITVTGANDGPTAVADALAVTEDAAVATGSVATNDADVDGDALTYALISPVDGLTLNANGSYQFDPSHAAYQALAERETRDVVARYTVSDGHGGTAEATLTIRVTGVADIPPNHAPVARPDTFDTTRDGALLTGSVAGNDSDPDGDPLTYRLLQSASGLTMNPDGSFTFDPMHPDYRSIPATGSREILVEYEVSDGKGGVARAGLLIDVYGVNDAPTAARVTLVATEDDPVVRGSLGAADPDGDVLTYVLPDPAPAGLTFDGRGGYAFDPSHPAYQDLKAGEVFTIVTTYTVVDPTGATATAALTITLTGTNDTPVAVVDVAAATEDGAVLAGSVASNDTDVDGDPLSYALTAPVAGLTFDADGNYSFDPSDAAYQDLDEGQTRNVVATYTVSDGHGGVSTATLTITVSGRYDRPNVAPVVVADDAAASEGGAPIPGSVAANDTDADGDALHYAVITGAPGLTLNTDGSYSFDPGHADYQNLGQGQTRVVVASYVVTDGFGGRVNSTLTITVTGTNDAPYAVIDAREVTEDAGMVTGTVAANDGDDDTGAVLTYAVVSSPVTGFTMTDKGEYRLNLNSGAYQALAEGETMDVVVTYTVTDQYGATATSSLTITVTGVNDAPVVNPEAWTATEDGVGLAGNVRGNDGDIDHNATAIYSLNAPVPGLTLDRDGNWTFDPTDAAYQDLARGQTRSVVATYTRTDEHGAQASTTLTITVTGVNDTPVAQNDGLTVHEDAGSVSGSVATNDSDADIGRVLTYALVDPATGLSMGADGSYTFDTNHPEYQSIPLGETREIKVLYSVTDQYGAEARAYLTLMVTGANDAPTADAATAATIEDGPEITGSVAGTGHDVDDRTTLKFALARPVAGLAMDEHGAWRFNPADAAYDDIPNNEPREVEAEYTVTDQHGASTTSTLTIVVTGANTAPTAIDDDAYVEEGGGIFGRLDQNDGDPDQGAVLTYSFNRVVPGLSLTSSTGGFYFDSSDPAYDYLGEGDTDSIIVGYTVSDGQGGTDTGQLTIHLTGTNDAPVAVPESAVANEDGAKIMGSVATNDDDPDTPRAALVYSLSAAVAGLTFNADGSYEFDPADEAYQSIPAGQTRDVHVNYRVTDGDLSSTATLTITVSGANDAPVGSTESYIVVEDGVLSVPAARGVLANDDDPDNQVLNARLFAGPQHGSLTLNPDGSFVYTPSADYTGSDTFTYVANDGAVDSAPITVFLTVAPVNSTAVAFTTSSTEFGALGGEQLVNTNTAGSQDEPRIARLAGGGFVVVWESGDGDGTGIQAQRYDAAGHPVGAEFQVNTSTQGYQYTPSVTGLSDGTFVVSWTDQDTGQIRAQLFDASGNRVDGEIRVDGTGSSSEGDITALAGGGFVVTWTDGSEAIEEGLGIRAQMYDATGAPVGGVIAVNAQQLSNQSHAAVTALPGGGFIVHWVDVYTGQVMIQMFDGSGGKVGAETHIPDIYPETLVGLPGGGFVACWQENRPGSGDVIYTQIFDSSCQPVGPAVPAETTSSHDQTSPAITILTDGGFLLVYTEHSAQNGDGSEGCVKAQRFDSSGARVGEAFVVNSTTQRDQASPQVEALADGGYAITWSDNSGVGDNSNSGIKLQVFGDLPPFAAVEQEALNLKGKISILDDADATEITVVLTVDHGVLNMTAGSSGASVSGSGSNTVTITGSLAQINALLNADATSAARYVSTGDSPPANALLSITIYDGSTPIGTGAQILSIRAVNDAPVIGADAPVAVDEGGALLIGDLASNDADPDGDTLIYTLVNPVTGFSLDTHGVYSFDPSDPWWGRVEPGDTWDISVEYEVSDGRGFVATRTFIIQLTGVEDGPPDFTFAPSADESRAAGGADFAPESGRAGNADEAALAAVFGDDLIPVGGFEIAAVERGDFAHHHLDLAQMFSEGGEDELAVLLGAVDFGGEEAVALGETAHDFAIPDGFVVLDPLDPLLASIHSVV